MLSFYRTTNLDLSIFRVLWYNMVFSAKFSPDFGHWECINSRDSYVILWHKIEDSSNFFYMLSHDPSPDTLFRVMVVFQEDY